MEEDLGTLKSRSFISTISLFFQSGYSAALGLVANLILTILLTPHIFGIYITVLSIIAFLNYFSDIGLSGALIQKKEITDDDLVTTFTIQQGLTLILVAAGFIFTPFIQNFYKLPVEGAYLFWALLISFFISSMKTIPSVLLERKIKFEKIVFVQAVENTIFYIAVSLLAIFGMGLRSFTIAVLLRAFVGFILIYSISFWMPKVGISKISLRRLLSFGIPFQASSFLALFKDDLIILYLGKVLGFEALGYIGWAKKWADAPIRIIMDNVSRVLFPLIAKYQDSKEKIRHIAERTLYYQTALIAPFYLGMIMIMKYMVDIIPHYNKWQPALPLFYIFSLSSLLLSFSAPFMNLFNALGRVKISFTFMAIFTIVTWSLTPILTHTYGYFGFPTTHLVVSVIFLAVLLKAKAQFGFSFWRPIYKFLISAFIMTLVLYFMETLVHSSSSLFVGGLVLIGGIVYLLMITVFFGLNIKKEIQSFVVRA